MGDLIRGISFSDTAPGNAVNAAKLHQLVESAAIQPSFLSTKADASSEVADGDKLLVLQLSSSQLRTISCASLVSKATAGALSALPIAVSLVDPGAAFHDNSHVWFKNTGNFQTSGLRMWDATASKQRRVYNVPVGVVLGLVPAGTFDTSGLGTGAFDGWAICNGANGTATIAASTGISNYIQFIGYTS